MKLVLKRSGQNEAGVTGILSGFKDQSTPQEAIAVTLEHAYNGEPKYAPKLLPGTYTCIRGMHRLHGMTIDFETFEVTGVLGHSGILFHVGNYNEDSDGCILLGHTITHDANGRLMITDSKLTFQRFMALLVGLQSFELSVEQ